MDIMKKRELKKRIIDGENIKITYEMFGAIGDGNHDDYDSLREAHHFVNDLYVNHNILLTVHAVKGHTYYLCDSHNVPISIATNVDWEGANFIIDDFSLENDFRKLREPLFHVVSPMKIGAGMFTVDYDDGVVIDNANFSSSVKNVKEFVDVFLDSISKNDKYSMCQKYFDNSKVIGLVVKNYNCMFGIEQDDVIFVDKESGNVLSDIECDYDHIKEISVWPIPNKKIKISGGNFLTVTNNRCVDNDDNKYYINRAIFINSTGNVLLENIHHYLDERYQYHEGGNVNSYLGFIIMSRASFVGINHVYLTPHTYPCLIDRNRFNEYMGSYDLYLENSQNIYIDGLKCEDNDLMDSSKLGVMACKGSKNVCIINSIIGYREVSDIIHNKDFNSALMENICLDNAVSSSFKGVRLIKVK